MNEGGAGAGKGHGKVILLGEHSVVYGRPAIAVGIARGCSAQAEFGSVDTLAVEPWGVQIEAGRPEADPERELLRRAFAKLCERYDSLPSARKPLFVRARMEIPGRAGLGGSASLSVAILRAMDARLGRDPGPDELLASSLCWEGVFHGNPSGIDSALAIRGGLALYRRGEPLAAIRIRRPVYLVVANSGEHGDTKDMVDSVARQHARDPIKTEQIFDGIEALVVNAKSALENGDHASLGQLMDLNQKVLNTLLLSTTKLEEMCRIARGAGALGAKLTGGGGGGCMIALAHDSESALPIVRAIQDASYDAFVVEVAP